MEQTLKNLPIGIQDFEKLRKENYLYVDKTALMHRLVSTGSYYFLSRPRRFGKSLLISTLKAYFLGKKDLFKGLAVEGNIHVTAQTAAGYCIALFEYYRSRR